MTAVDFLKWPCDIAPSHELQSWLVAALDLLAVSVCAITGVLAARGKRMDLVGLTVVAVVSSLGGGTIRDVLLGKLPVFWVAQPAGLVAALLAGWTTFAVVARKPVAATTFQIPDALGLGLFTIVGTEKALVAGHGWLVAAVMGVITGAFGGVLRDIVCREIPSVFKRTELYAAASLLGALAYIVCRGCGSRPLASVIAGVALVVVVRLAAVRWRWRLPALRD